MTCAVCAHGVRERVHFNTSTSVTTTQDTLYSSYREILIEHLFVGEIMRKLWLRDISQFEVLKPQVDDSGYDLVLEANAIVRHVQLKSSFDRARTGQVRASLKLMSKPSACVVWVRFEPKTMGFDSFGWFGGAPGEPLPDITHFKIAKHTRANAQGVKKERPNQRSIPLRLFERIGDIDTLVTRMFGSFPIASAEKLNSVWPSRPLNL